MKQITLGGTGIVTPQNAFGALPIQRVTTDEAVHLLRRAFDGGMTFFDTARAYSNSEERVGLAFEGMRDQVTIATKSMAQTPEALAEDLETSLRLLRTDHVDLYQFHCVNQVWRPGDGTGMYEAMEEFKRQGKIGHICVTAHKIGVAEDLVESGLYETLQYPLSYLASDREIALVRRCAEKNVGFIAMKGLAGGLLSNSRACMAFMSQFDNVVPIWGVQKEQELDEWLSYMGDATPTMDEEMAAFIEAERAELTGNFCRGCGYCMPCPQGITINQCARMSLMLRRAPSQGWLSEHWQQEMAKIEGCTNCGRCRRHCPYELNIPELLKANLADYRSVLAGETAV
ncbi:MAG: aldo/keto reductase [Coriobacteriia bacterium]|nr:aldo/keto reductase [Coriobacteriia bacterium]MBS5477159.1 aldo/keto reductase [Coriobacteriia bacterium]